MRPAILDRERAADYLSMGQSTFEKLVQRDMLPKPRQLTARLVGWLPSELDAWAESRPVSQGLPPENCGRNQ